MGFIQFPPTLQRFMRGKRWWNIISTTPAYVLRYSFRRNPIIGLSVGYGIYQYFYVQSYAGAAEGRYERWRQNFRADLHMQENVNWKTKDGRDSMNAFITKQIEEHGSFENAVAAYTAKSGTPKPTFVVDDAVLDYTLRRVGVPVEGPEEPFKKDLLKANLDVHFRIFRIFTLPRRQKHEICFSPFSRRWFSLLHLFTGNKSFPFKGT